MAKDETKMTTPSGALITESDLKAIQKKTIRDVVVGGFALAGLIAVGGVVRMVSRGQITVTHTQPSAD